MTKNVYDLNKTENREIAARLSFDIATSRQLGHKLIRFAFSAMRDERFKKLLAQHLRLLKKKGRIDLFVFSSDFSRQTTESAYLFNKFPEIQEEVISDGEIIVFVKIQ